MNSTLRSERVRARKIHHAQVFFQYSGDPIRILNHQYERWRQTMQSLQLHYRRPYCARHSPVSWNLMIGKNPLWVAKERPQCRDDLSRLFGLGERNQRGYSGDQTRDKRAERTGSRNGVAPAIVSSVELLPFNVHA